jgi:hypothetical protein
LLDPIGDRLSQLANGGLVAVVGRPASQGVAQLAGVQVVQGWFGVEDQDAAAGIADTLGG